MSDHHIRLACHDDLERLLPLLQTFHGDEHIRWDEPRVRGGLESLLADPGLGRLLLIERDGALAGYLVVAFCFSLEFGGRHGLLDEVYVLPAHRGGGIGRRALDHAEAVCREAGLAAIRLEVGDDNPLARGIYVKRGYAEQPRRLMTRWLDA